MIRIMNNKENNNSKNITHKRKKNEPLLGIPINIVRDRTKGPWFQPGQVEGFGGLRGLRGLGLRV